MNQFAIIGNEHAPALKRQPGNARPIASTTNLSRGRSSVGERRTE